MITRLAHVCITATDLSEAERFYCGALGFEKVFEFIRDGAVTGFYLRVAGMSFIEVFKGAAPDVKAAAPIRHICLETADLDAVREKLRSAGYEVTEKKMGADQSWQAWTTDPSGVRIEFHQYTALSSQTTFAPCVLP